jgi:chemotaxis protein histidine kinase CheA/CheY-like chemotaxis protein
LAHRIEDLLGRLSEKNIDPSASQIALLNDAADCLKLLSSVDKPQNIDARLTNLHQQFDAALSQVTTEGPISPRSHVPEFTPETDANTPATNPSNRNKSIVRISLDKLDDLVSQVGELIASQSAFKVRFRDLERQLDETHNNTLRLKAATLKIEKNYDLSDSNGADNGLELRQGSYEFSESTRDASIISNELKDVKTDLENLYLNECTLIDEIQTRLVRLRNVEFGTITNRLQRTVRVTCDEEEKRAEVVVENGSLEVDTQVIDALIEPLLHLLKNAVVHGIEPAETRRMLGKSETGKITVRVSNKGSYFVLSVTDDGRGIAFRPLLEKAVTSNLISVADAEEITTDKILELIFLPGLTTAKKLSLNAGRGVGMSIVRESVAAAGGIVSIETWPQKGTTFSIRIPRPFADRNSADNGIDAKKAIQLPAKKRTTLIVDDSPSVRMMTAKAVENAGWHAEVARDGIEALEKLRVIRRPDVILSDIEMPRMGGYEFVAALGDDDNLKDIPVIFISSRVNESERAEAVGVIECLTKPYDERKLVDTICRVSATELVMS